MKDYEKNFNLIFEGKHPTIKLKNHAYVPGDKEGKYYPMPDPLRDSYQEWKDAGEPILKKPEKHLSPLAYGFTKDYKNDTICPWGTYKGRDMAKNPRKAPESPFKYKRPSYEQDMPDLMTLKAKRNKIKEMYYEDPKDQAKAIRKLNPWPIQDTIDKADLSPPKIPSLEEYEQMFEE